LVSSNSRGQSFFAKPDAQHCLAATHGVTPSWLTRLRFAEPPWNSQSPEWLAIDRKLAHDDLARTIGRLVDEEIDLKPLYSSYAGRGNLPHRPDLLLKLVLYELQEERPKPAQWFKDHKKNIAIQWLTFGSEISRSVLYEFRDRVQPVLDSLNQQVIRKAIDEKHTDASTASLDGSFVAANASRHRLLTLKIVEERLKILDEEIAKTEAEEAAKQRPQIVAVTDAGNTGVVVEALPARPENAQDRQPAAESPADPTTTQDRGRSFMAKTPRGRKRQRVQYRKAREILQQRNQINARRRKDKRKKPEKVRVAIGDSMAPFGRDKMKVYRPVYNLQTMTDVQTDLVLAFSVTPTLSDSGHLVPMIDRTTATSGQPLKRVLTDAGYPSGEELAQCEARNTEVMAPWNENSFTAERRAKAGQEGLIRKDEFTWDPTIPGYRCPRGHSLTYRERTTKQKANGDSVPLEIYQADPADCKECPLKARCVHGRSGARTVRRQPHEDLIEKMKERMKTPEGKALYRLRGCTVERRFADLKTYRGAERISGRTPERAQAQIGLAILAHNLLTLDKLRKRGVQRENPPKIAV
jgi:transposase